MCNRPASRVPPDNAKELLIDIAVEAVNVPAEMAKAASLVTLLTVTLADDVIVTAENVASITASSPLTGSMSPTQLAAVLQTVPVPLAPPSQLIVDSKARSSSRSKSAETSRGSIR